MKNVLSIVLQLILFLVGFFIGTILAGVNTLPTLSISIGPSRVFVYDGVLVMLGLYGLILIVHSIRRHLRSAWVNSTVALGLAFVFGLAMKFGFKSI